MTASMPQCGQRAVPLPSEIHSLSLGRRKGLKAIEAATHPTCLHFLAMSAAVLVR